MRKIPLLLLLSACNAVNIKPHSLDKSQLFYADRGGYSMKFAVKDELEKRGYKINVGKQTTSSLSTESSYWDNASVPEGARYVIKVQERVPRFSPIICIFNGFYWWRFNVSIADQKTGEELFAWTGKGCVNSVLRRLSRLIDELEQ